MSNQRFLATIYGRVSTIDNLNSGLQMTNFFGAGGQQRSFANNYVEVRPVSPKQTLNNVDINSIIVILPQGLNQKEVWYAAVDLVTTINTNGQ